MIDIVNYTHYQLEEEDLSESLQVMVHYLDHHHNTQASSISLAFVQSEQIHQLNLDFLGKDKPTDILSFPASEEEAVGGDIALCPEVIFQHIKEDQSDADRYFAFVILHGLLHLYGMEHDYTEASLLSVYDKQNKILDELKLDWSHFHVVPH